jgi:hypothetical protein
MSEVVVHPYQEAMVEAKRELAIARTPEAEAMLEAILTAIQHYTDYLDREGLFYNYEHPEDPDDMPIVVSEALVITSHPCFGIDIILKNGSCRVFMGLAPIPIRMDVIRQLLQHHRRGYPTCENTHRFRSVDLETTRRMRCSGKENGSLFPRTDQAAPILPPKRQVLRPRRNPGELRWPHSRILPTWRPHRRPLQRRRRRTGLRGSEGPASSTRSNV